MIKRLKEPVEILMLLDSNDPCEDILPMRKMEWIQWLVKVCTNDDYFILANFNDYEMIDGYFVLKNNFYPPLSTSANVLYTWHDELDIKIVSEMVELTKDWAKEKGLDSLRSSCERVDELKKYGFHPTGKIIMEMIL